MSFEDCPRFQHSHRSRFCDASALGHLTRSEFVMHRQDTRTPQMALRSSFELFAYGAGVTPIPPPVSRRIGALYTASLVDE
jgi:hypothetical protein